MPGGVYDYGVIFKIKPDGSEFQKIVDFEATNDGYEPRGALVFSSTKAYGITSDGGKYNKGVIYEVNPDGTGYKSIFEFSGVDGAAPIASLTLSGGILYGTTTMGGSNNMGVLFKINISGEGYEAVVNFTENNGEVPEGSLFDADSLLYGMTRYGGINDKGVIFEYDKKSKALKSLFEFSGTDAMYPYGSIVFYKNKLYGMCLGAAGNGVVFSMNTDGSEFKKLLDVSSTTAGRYGNSLIISDSTIYATTTQGGSKDWGVLFKLKIDGTGFQKLVDFVYTNGAIPDGPIVLKSDSTIYGLTKLGGPSDSGVLYKVNTDGTDFEIIVDLNNWQSLSGGRVASVASLHVTAASLSLSSDVLYTVISSQSEDTKSGGIFKHDLKSTAANPTTPTNPTTITGIENSIDQSFQVYPNPTNNFINIQNDTNQPYSYHLMDALGRDINIQMIEKDLLDVCSLPTGLYNLVINSKNFKIVKF